MRDDLSPRRRALREVALAPALFVVLAAVVLVSLLVGVGPAGSSALSVKNGKVAFVDSSPASIWVMNADGSGQRRLTHAPAFDWEPAWSPDGKKIAFASFRDRNEEIYVMNADGTGQKRLTHNGTPVTTSSQDWKPAWSPNGKKIAFTTGRDFGTAIYVMNADGSGQRNLTRNKGGYDERPAWSPDGKKIVFTSGRNSGYAQEIYVMNADGSHQTRLTHNLGDDLEPDWQALP